MASTNDEPTQQPISQPDPDDTTSIPATEPSPQAEPASDTGPAPGDEAGVDGAAPGEPVEPGPAGVEAPLRAPRKRAARKRTAPPVQQPDGDETADAIADEEPPATAPASVGFGVLFQPPEPIMVPRRAAREVTNRDPAAEEAPDEAPARPSEDGTDDGEGGRRRRRRGGKGRQRRTDDDADRAGTDGETPHETDTGTDEAAADTTEPDAGGGADGEAGSRRRTRRRRRSGSAADVDDAPGVVTKVRQPRPDADVVVGVKGSTRLEAKKRRRREGREAGRRRTVITEAEFLARRESVERVMVVRGDDTRTQIAVLEDGVLVEHYVSRQTTVSGVGNIYLGRVQNVLPSMEAAFVDIGRGRNAVLYAGEVNWDAAGLESHQAKRIENALEPGQAVMVQVTKDPVGHKGARLTSQISLPGRFLVYVPDSSMTGISRKLPDTERARLKKILRDAVPESAGVIVRTAAEGASEAELRADIDRLTATWEQITTAATTAGWGKKGKTGAPMLLHGEPDLTVRVIRDIFNEDFAALVVAGDQPWQDVSGYVEVVAPDLTPRLSRWTGEDDLFAHYRVDEQIAKAMDRKVWLPSGGSLVIDRTEAMTVVDVNTGKFVGSGGDLEETVTRNNLEAAEEIVRQLRLRDIGGIIVVDFIDMVLESNRDLVVRRLVECLGRDRTKHQVAEVSSLGLVQMTRKRVGSGLIEVFSTTCEHCNGRGYLVHADPVERGPEPDAGPSSGGRSRGRRGRGAEPSPSATTAAPATTPSGPTPAQIAAAAHAAAVKSTQGAPTDSVEPEPDAPAAPGDPPTMNGETPAEAVETDETDRLDTPLMQSATTVPQASASQEASTEQAEPEACDEEATGVVSLGWGTDRPVTDTGRDAGDASAELPVTDQAESAPRPRRKRGRVVAPAGPPRIAEG